MDVEKAKQRAINARRTLDLIEPQYREITEKYEKALKAWKKAAAVLESKDYLMALHDGRTKKIEQGFSPKELTDKQKIKIMKELGIDLE